MVVAVDTLIVVIVVLVAPVAVIVVAVLVVDAVVVVVFVVSVALLLAEEFLPRNKFFPAANVLKLFGGCLIPFEHLKQLFWTVANVFTKSNL